MSRHIFSFDKHPLNKDKSVMADNGKSYLRIYGEGVIDRIHYDMLGKEIYMPLMDEIVIEEGVQLPVNSKYLFYTYDCRIVIYKNIDVFNIMDANCMFALTGNANPDTSLWELNPKCIVTDMFKNAKAGIIVTGDMKKTLKDSEDYWIEDCSAATENILLAIEALGLGGVWTGIYPSENRVNKLKNYFNLPKNIIPFNLIAIGHPKGNQNIKNKWDENKIHWEKW